MNKNTLIITIISVIFIIGFLLIVYSATNKPVNTVFPDVNKVLASDHIKWSPDKKNLLVEYSDFQCPACKNFHDLLRKMEASSSPDFDITKKVTFIYRNYPLYQIHQNATTAAYAAEAAGLQGKFFEMGDGLFDNQASLEGTVTKEFYSNLGKSLGLDVDKFNKDMDSQPVKDKVNADQLSGGKTGLNSTPTFFFNGQKLDNIQSFDQFKTLLRGAK